MPFHAELADRVLAQIKAHPETWNQEDYRCETGMCFAGWACELSGVQWYGGPDEDYSDYTVGPDGSMVPADVVARRLLGIPLSEGAELFHFYNDLTALEVIVNELKSATQTPIQ